MNPTGERLDDLLRRGAELWRDFQAGRGSLFHGFIPADHRGAYEVLVRERDSSHSFLELGSGIGMITVLADRSLIGPARKMMRFSSSMSSMDISR